MPPKEAVPGAVEAEDSSPTHLETTKNHHDSDEEDTRKIVMLDGVYYDLTDFEHPGGSYVIQKAVLLTKECNIDSGPMLRQYHSVFQWDKMFRVLKKYRMDGVAPGQFSAEAPIKANYKAVGTDPADYDYTAYRKLRERVEKIYPFQGSKAGFSQFAVVALQITLLAFSYYYAWLHQDERTFWLPYVCGLQDISFLFNTLHDLSHFAIFRNPIRNVYVSQFINGFALWKNDIWHDQHVVRHHSFTGDHVMDPDTMIHQMPSAGCLSSWYPQSVFQAKFNAVYKFILQFPIQFPVQIWMYRRNHPDRFRLNMYTLNIRPLRIASSMLHYIGVASKIALIYFCFGVYWKSALWFFIMGDSTFYALNIMGDHDLIQTWQNHYNGSCWLTRQICNTGNFINAVPPTEYGYMKPKNGLERVVLWLLGNRLVSEFYTRAFGGINFQIEHHLFPSYGHSYQRSISPLVREECQRLGLPYAHSPTILHLFRDSFLALWGGCDECERCHKTMCYEVDRCNCHFHKEKADNKKEL